MSLARIIRIYLVPGAVFQSILVGGGYGTGREVLEYFTRFGPLGGLLAAGLALVIFCIVLSLTFEIGRVFSAYDYRAFFKILLGRFWFIYEIAGFIFMMLVIAVLISAGSGVLSERFGVPGWVGMALVFSLVGGLEFMGREVVMRVLTFWSVVLYVVFATFLFLVFDAIGDQMLEVFQSGEAQTGWAESGFKYAMYNMTGAPIILYVAREFTSRKHSIGAGVIAALIGIIPAIMFHLAFSAEAEKGDLLATAIPVYWMMSKYGMAVLSVAFTVMLFGTLVETGAGIMQGVNERVDSYLKEHQRKPLNRWGHTGVALAFMALAMLVSSVGIVSLIAAGYGTLGWVFAVIYLLPLLTVGLWKLHLHKSDDLHPADISSAKNDSHY